MQAKDLIEFLSSVFELELKNQIVTVNSEINVKLENGNLATIKILSNKEEN